MSQLFQNVEVPIDELPQFQEVQLHPVSRKYKTMHLVISSIIALIAAGGFVAINIAADWTVWFLFGFPALYWLVHFVVVTKGYPWIGYAIREHDVIFRRGWIFRSTTVIPYSKIQHGEVRQSFVERIYGMSRLKLFTAGGTSSDLVIPAIADEEANKLRDFVMTKVKQQEDAI